MLKTIFSATAASAVALAAGTAIAQTGPAPQITTPVETPAPDLPDATVDATAQAEAASTATPAGGTIAAAVAANADLTTLGGALTAADLTATLSGPGPFTVFAPTNAAFDLIPADTRTALMQPANKASLATILKFHVVEGNVTAAQLKQQIEAGNGTAQLQTVAGQTLSASLEGENIVLTGENNSKAYVTLADQSSSNGTVHVVNGILVPRLG